MRVLVTGADGFVGRHLLPALAAAGHQAVSAGGPGASGLALSFDLTDASAVRAAVEHARPEGVIHLAGFSSVARSHQSPPQAFAVNALGTVHLLAALREVAPSARVVLVGSGEMYGPVPPGEAADERTPLLPTNPYAASKAAAELAGFQFFRSYGLKVISARPFNHLGKGQLPHFVVPSFASQIVDIKRGRAPALLRVGDLEPLRDFSHVGDVVDAYLLLLERGVPGEAYNVGSGAARSIRSLLEELLELAKVDARIEVDPQRLRPAEIPSLVGSPQKLRALGWKPSRTVTQALSDVLEELAQPR
jgi:GDP-4-dehydro-6-deoxy-D-mannose reductase